MLGTNPDFSAISLIRDRRSSGTSSSDGTSNMLLTLTRGQQADLAARVGEDGAGPLPALLAGRGPGRYGWCQRGLVAGSASRSPSASAPKPASVSAWPAPVTAWLTVWPRWMAPNS